MAAAMYKRLRGGNKLIERVGLMHPFFCQWLCGWQLTKRISDSGVVGGSKRIRDGVALACKRLCLFFLAVQEIKQVGLRDNIKMLYTILRIKLTILSKL